MIRHAHWSIDIVRWHNWKVYVDDFDQSADFIGLISDAYRLGVLVTKTFGEVYWLRHPETDLSESRTTKRAFKQSISALTESFHLWTTPLDCTRHGCFIPLQCFLLWPPFTVFHSQNKIPSSALLSIGFNYPRIPTIFNLLKQTGD